MTTRMTRSLAVLLVCALAAVPATAVDAVGPVGGRISSCLDVDVAPNPVPAGSVIVVSGGNVRPGTDVEARLEVENGQYDIRQSPAGPGGGFRFRFIAPLVPGMYSVQVTASCPEGSPDATLSRNVVIMVDEPITLTLDARRAGTYNVVLEWEMSPTPPPDTVYVVKYKIYRKSERAWSEWRVLLRGTSTSTSFDLRRKMKVKVVRPAAPKVVSNVLPLRP